MNELTLIQRIAVLILPVLFAITLHEAAHGWVASRLGDDTARRLGRVSINPLRHIDPLGTVIIPLAMYLLTNFLFGWAKPVPVDFRRLKNPRRDMALVALAGPGANLLMLFLWGAVLRFSITLDSVQWFAEPLFYMGIAGMFINAILLVLNMLPILPLDGGRVLAALLPPELARRYAALEPWGLVIVVALLVSGVLGKVMWPLIEALQALVGALFGFKVL